MHRDLKPSNLFLAQRPDGTPTLKVIDFGLAKSLRDADSVVLTHTGAILGSPWFMAPEQMRGLAVDERADIWALGATLYALLTGLPPFAGKNMLDVYDRILAGPPKLAELSPAGGALEAVVHRCLRIRPAERYASVAEFADDLVAAVAFQVTKAERVRRIAEGASLVGATTDQPCPGTDPEKSPLPGMTVPPRDPSWHEPTLRGRTDTHGPLITQSWPTQAPRRNAGRRAMVALGLVSAFALGGLAHGVHRRHATEEHLGRREEREAGVLVLVVVPAEECAQPSTGVEQAREEARIVGLVLEGLEPCLAERVSVGKRSRLIYEGSAAVAVASASRRGVFAAA